MDANRYGLKFTFQITNVPYVPNQTLTDKPKENSVEIVMKILIFKRDNILKSLFIKFLNQFQQYFHYDTENFSLSIFITEF